MSDYLNNIVARSLGVADVVQPRLPQLFERSNEYRAEPPDTTFEIEVEQNTSPGSHEAAGWRPAQERTPLTFPDFEAPNRIETPSSPIGARIETSDSAQTHPPAVAADPNAKTIDATPEPESLTPARATALPQTQQQDSSSRSQPPTSRERVSVLEVKKPAPTAATVAPPPLPPALLPVTTRDVRIEEPPRPIRITIGRVDVRAVFPPAPASRAAAVRPKPALSLESYLKEREQGKR